MASTHAATLSISTHSVPQVEGVQGIAGVPGSVADTAGSDHKARLLRRLALERGVLVKVESTQGSVPRETGSWMAVFAADFIGTIGGGRLEFEALERARGLLLAWPFDQFDSGGNMPARSDVAPVRFALGPSLGQCCGGVVYLGFENVDATDIPRLRDALPQTRYPLAIFGGGHVGHALVAALARLPFDLRWIDSRDEVFPAALPVGVVCESSHPVQAAVRDLVPGSRILIMSFSHAEDLDVVAACLLRQREGAQWPFIGLIGSKTKWATFRHRLAAKGFSDTELDQVTCPIGIAGITGKEPEVIAIAVAAQLLQSVYAG